eukprot:CAMPEP_0183572936 /NCGR_PEP_ID=MMETSP0371-20130417/129727_1 /TAXON_ID=268820 /ORGANISM="Peridinium aciculiferum, Strain PAER-2" /LENGTH=47 /DNA_ID= /DNA_START= /DNA_END= /DNA_ORIENTATION=
MPGNSVEITWPALKARATRPLRRQLWPRAALLPDGTPFFLNVPMDEA